MGGDGGVDCGGEIGGGESVFVSVGGCVVGGGSVVGVGGALGGDVSGGGGLSGGGSAGGGGSTGGSPQPYDPFVPASNGTVVVNPPPEPNVSPSPSPAGSSRASKCWTHTSRASRLSIRSSMPL